jgi:citrate lyase subunit beta/citryl-CoA lyase
VLAATDIACVEGVRTLTLDGAGLRRDLHLADGHLPTLYVRSRLVVVCGAAGLEPPIDGAYPVANDGTGLREEARAARSLGFFGKAAIHPRQLPIIHEVFAPTDAELVWAREVVDAFAGTRGAALRLPSGELVDVPVAQRAQRILELADGLRSS